MKVFKFGGASIKDADSLRNMLSILQQQNQNRELLIVVSAMGKMTNAFEDLLKCYWQSESYEEKLLFIKNYHFNIAQKLFVDNVEENIFAELTNVFQDIQNDLLELKKESDFNKVYDHVVAFGELISSKIISAFLNKNDISNQWIDARKFIKTDSTWREGKVDWALTEENIQSQLTEILNQKIIITQGFIGSNESGETITLGREGSDFSAAIFANCLHAVDLTIWKDVAGVLNADPKKIKDAQLFSQLSYQEATEMTYYGATVIHPKTIAPLAKKKITLLVKSFLNPHQAGTCINQQTAIKSIPTIIFKENQILLKIKAKDITFLEESQIAQLFHLIHSLNLKVNFIQKFASSLFVLVDNQPNKIDSFVKSLSTPYQLDMEQHLILLTVIKSNEHLIHELSKEKIILAQQRKDDFWQAILK